MVLRKKIVFSMSLMLVMLLEQEAFPGKLLVKLFTTITIYFDFWMCLIQHGWDHKADSFLWKELLPEQSTSNVFLIVQSYASIEWLCIFSALAKYIDLQQLVNVIKCYLSLPVPLAFQNAWVILSEFGVEPSIIAGCCHYSVVLFHRLIVYCLENQTYILLKNTCFE